ncbi:TIGR03619 family F420-dependent LLM class oxidoreductase [Planotetraspora mira]|jgi:probable F420-dependent oxidoreductase|uniref:F420-dependent oxidoreductase n=1 Tax=Planotetraspora mira TaxID=58121 RepID=A0A8J3X7E8_9ACTN|nr:TIGR03619 family F420-dependent LLM class oxidoreductase [Planotetraspora mira]GII30530.1 F420-dependent oxidoreductase [Planotetraspora mira]
MRLGIAPHRLWPDRDGDLEGVLETARTAERLGFDHVIAGSHVLRTGLGATLDPIVLLSAVAGATSRIRIATSVLIAPLYQPVILAHQTASLDFLSGGRFVLGVGTGWDAAEFSAVGVPFGQRGRRTDENLATMKALWQEEFTEARIGVSPLTPGGPPVWVGGDSDAALRRALCFGDAWHGSGNPAAMAGVRRRIADLAESIGRDPATLALTSVAFLVPPGVRQIGRVPVSPLGGTRPSAGSVVEELGQLKAAGVTTCSLWLPVSAAALPDALAWIAEQVMPSLDAGSSRPSPL